MTAIAGVLVYSPHRSTAYFNYDRFNNDRSDMYLAAHKRRRWRNDSPSKDISFPNGYQSDHTIALSPDHRYLRIYRLEL